MKPGDLVVSRSGAPQLFLGVYSDWTGIVISNEKPPGRETKYNLVRVVLLSHGGGLDKTWLTDDEIRDYLEVLSEAG